MSGDTIAYTQSFSGSTSLFASVKALAGDPNFDFNSVYLTAGWRDNIGVRVTGLRDGVSIYDMSFMIGDDARTLMNLHPLRRVFV